MCAISELKMSPWCHAQESSQLYTLLCIESDMKKGIDCDVIIDNFATLKVKTKFNLLDIPDYLPVISRFVLKKEFFFI